MSDLTPTRSALLELLEERRVMQEGYSFLDEKRLLLAGEMLRQLARYAELHGALRTQWEQAAAALSAAVGRHGLEGLWCYPPADRAASKVRIGRRSLLGVVLQEAVLEGEAQSAPLAANPSPEAERCRARFGDVMVAAAALAAAAGNLERLRVEYRQTERRARALENVLLPEVESAVREMDERLEEAEREDAIRGRYGR